jgi:hypothetical protein
LPGAALAETSSMERPAAPKATLSQQILRTFRSRSSAAAPSLDSSSATASTLPGNVDRSLAVGLSSGTKIPSVETLSPDAPLYPFGLPESAPLSRSEFEVHAAELRKPIPLSQPRRDEVTTEHEQRLRAILAAVRNAAEKEAAMQPDEPMSPSSPPVAAPGSAAAAAAAAAGGETPASAGPTTPQIRSSDVFRLCIALLGQAKDLPVAIRVGVCDLVSESVRLSSRRAAAAPKALAETRSGAPGSQSSKTADGDHALANIDRALLCHLVSDLSSGFEEAHPSRDNVLATALPALPSQLQALEVLTNEGRDVVAFPGIVQLLGDWLGVVWAELQTLRSVAQAESKKAGGKAPAPAAGEASTSTQQAGAGRFSAAALSEQLSLREWNMQAILHLATSIFKFSFARIDLSHVEQLYDKISRLFLGDAGFAPETPRQALSPAKAAAPAASSQHRRSRSKEAKSLTDGYDYYGLETLSPSPGSQSPSPSMTPHGVMTPRLAASESALGVAAIVAAASAAAAAGAAAAGASIAPTPAVAPIVLATLPPSTRAEDVEQAPYPVCQPHAELHAVDVRALLRLFDATLRYGYMPPPCVNAVTRVLCGILGYQTAVGGNLVLLSADASAADEHDWVHLVGPVIANLLRSHCANAALRVVRQMLVLPETDSAAPAPSRPRADAPEDVAILLGAVGFLRQALIVVAEQAVRAPSSTRTEGKQQNEDALAPSISLPLILPALRGALNRQVDVLDVEVLKLVAALLPEKSKGKDAADRQPLLAEPLSHSDWDALIDLTGVARRHTEGGKLKGRAVSVFDEKAPGVSASTGRGPSVSAPVLALLHTLSRVRLAGPTGVPSPADGEGGSKPLPWTPKLASLLLSLAPLLPDTIVVDLIQYFKTQHLCLPCEPNWIANMRSLLQAFFHRHESAARDFGALPAPRARRDLVSLIFEHVYEAVQDLPDERTTLMLEVIIPLAQSSLAAETDAEVEQAVRRVLIEAAVLAGSQPPELEQPLESTPAPAAEAEAEAQSIDSGAELGQQDNERLAAVELTESERIFGDIRQLFIKLARSSETVSGAPIISSVTATGHVSFADPPGSHDRTHNSGFASHSRQSSAGGAHASSGAPSSAAPVSAPSRTDRSSQSALDLITIFNRMAFSSSWVMISPSAGSSAVEHRQAWSKKTRASCLTIFRDLLKILHPSASARGGAGTAEKDVTAVAPPSTRTRLAILQWLVRLRTDRQHRVYFVVDVDDLVESAATALLRGPGSAPAPSALSAMASQSVAPQMEKQVSTGSTAPRPARSNVAATRQDVREGREQVRAGPGGLDRSKSRARDASRDRGRNVDRATGETGRLGERERSSSRTRGTSARKNGPQAPVEPQEALWHLPQEVLFEVPHSAQRSDVVFTYIHPEADPHCAHGHDHGIDDGGEPAVPLPVSEYLALAIQILAVERNWELVSYLICHLPHQLANKHLFCGPKARDQIMALRKQLCSDILSHTLASDVHLPEEVRKTDVYAVSYAMLTVLISYRTLFSRSQQDEMVEAFIVGLNKSQNTAQPCVRALSVSCYELQKSVTRLLPSMLVKLSTVMSSTTMSIHILELIAAIGHIPACYANFTEADYRRIFGMSLQYLQYHTQLQRTDAERQQQQAQQQQASGAGGITRDDPRSSPASFTLSQYVMMLAYYNISLWFISLRISDRPKHVPYIARGLLLANEGRERMSDQTEVCFDFLARFTHSNAEPKPRRSFLNSIVMGSSTAVAKAAVAAARKDNNRQSKSWLFGKALVTVTSLKKEGWIEILVRRSSGTIALLCKLENAPVGTLPDVDGERMDLPAVLMMQRDPDSMAKPAVMSPALPLAKATDRRSMRQQAEARLRAGDHLRSRRPLGPAHYGLARRPRAASFSGGLSSALITRTAPIDPYRIEAASGDAPAADELMAADVPRVGGPQVSATESAAVQSIKSEILSPKASEQKLAADSSSAAPESSEARRGSAAGLAAAPAGARPAREAAVDPGFIALQLSAFPDLSLDKAPLLLPDEPATDRLIRAVDLTPVVDFHKIGVLYVGPGQTEERQILGNRTGSPAYARFLSGLGDLITLKGQEDVYTGGLDRQSDEHGKYAYVWGDDISQIVYHTATLMPNRDHDAAHSAKKALIGNDWVHVVFNESGDEYRFGTIPSQFNFVNIVVSPNSRGGINLGSVAPDDSTFCECEACWTAASLCSPRLHTQIASRCSAAPACRTSRPSATASWCRRVRWPPLCASSRSTATS